MKTCGDDIDMISIDIANGHHVLMEEMVKYVKRKAPGLKIMAGNVATGEGYRFLAEDLGVDAVRVGIGGGSICKTRIQTGFGVPTLASVIDCYKMKIGRPDCKASIIADGGIKYPADVVKSLVAGADAVIAGSLFAGTKEAPGDIIYTNDGKAWKSYRGMASAEVQMDRKGGLKPGTVAEGVSQLTPYKGSLERVVNEFVGGLRSGMAYANSMTITELRDIEMIRITSSGVSESHAHGTRRR
jgi:IMP dehydrogenase